MRILSSGSIRYALEIAAEGGAARIARCGRERREARGKTNLREQAQFAERRAHFGAFARQVSGEFGAVAIARHHWSALYRNSRELVAYLEREREEMRATLDELGLLP